jgi:hypothetical protein
VWRTFVVDDDGSCSSSGFVVVDDGGQLHPQRGHASVKLGHLGIEGYLLTNKLVMALNNHELGVDLPCTGSH